MGQAMKQLAVVTGASTGIGYELAIQCARHGFDLVVAADEAAIFQAADVFRNEGVEVEALEAISQRPKAAINCTQRSRAVRWMPCWPMPAEGWAAPFSTRTGMTSAMS